MMKNKLKILLPISLLNHLVIKKEDNPGVNLQNEHL